jgi:endonuclease/exonuclease/phosphatase family metal-dependent hydrolase
MQNAALIPQPFYLGTDKDAAIASLKTLIALADADVVGLSEVWAPSEKESIRSFVDDTYPHYRQGPPGGTATGDGGLLLLSKHPFLTHHDVVYSATAGEDALKNKGILHVRVQPLDYPSSFDIFLTHTQNPDPIVSPGEDPIKVVQSQLSALEFAVTAFRNPQVPAFIMGDLNTDANSKTAYEDLLSRLSQPIDMWRAAGNPSGSGGTYTAGNNFYSDDDDKPTRDQRLDYILMKPGARFVPLVETMEVVIKKTLQGRCISDHFGLNIEWGDLVEITRATTATPGP